MNTNTAIRQIAYSNRDGANIVLPAGVNLIQRRTNLQPHRKLSRISVSAVATPIWQQQVIQPSSSLQQRFNPKETEQEYIQPTIALSAEQPLPQTDDTTLSNSLPAGSHVIPIPPKKTPKQPNKVISSPQDKSQKLDLPDLPLDQHLPEFQADLLQTVQSPTKPQQDRKEELNTNLKRLEENLTTVDNKPMPDLSSSLQQITDLRSKVQEQEVKMQELRKASLSDDFVANTKTKQALLSNLEHALINTQNELTHLEAQPNADVSLIKQIKEQLVIQKRAFDQLQRENKELLSPKVIAQQPPVNTQKLSPSVKESKPKVSTQPQATPLITSTPNAINGTVMTTEGKLVTGAIVIVKSAEGRPLRALKSNQLGQFLITTALENGPYLIETESDGLTFETVRVELTGGVVQPIVIKAK